MLVVLGSEIAVRLDGSVEKTVTRVVTEVVVDDAWSAMRVAWVILGLPLGPAGPLVYTP